MSFRQRLVVDTPVLPAHSASRHVVSPGDNLCQPLCYEWVSRGSRRETWRFLARRIRVLEGAVLIPLNLRAGEGVVRVLLLWTGRRLGR